MTTSASPTDDKDKNFPRASREGAGSCRRHEIIFTHGGGRFANQLMLFGHLIALVEECPDLSVCNFSFWPYATLCNGTEQNPFCRYPFRTNPTVSIARVHQALFQLVPTRLVLPLSRLIAHSMHLVAWHRATDHKNDIVDLSDPAVRRSFRECSWSLQAGWKFRDWTAFEKHADAIRDFLRPAKQFAAPSEKFLEKIRQSHAVVIGLLMRQTDYRGWAGGKYFRTSAKYRQIIDSLWERFGSDSAILLTSDERQDQSLFNHPNIYWAGGTAGAGHFMNSFSQLSMCDIVVSVPSTFAAWAAFLGNTSLLCCAGDIGSETLMAKSLLDARTHKDYGEAMFW